MSCNGTPAELALEVDAARQLCGINTSNNHRLFTQHGSISIEAEPLGFLWHIKRESAERHQPLQCKLRYTDEKQQVRIIHNHGGIYGRWLDCRARLLKSTRYVKNDSIWQYWHQGPPKFIRGTDQLSRQESVNSFCDMVLKSRQSFFNACRKCSSWHVSQIYGL